MNEELINELTRRHDLIQTKLGSDFLSAVRDYLDLLVLDPMFQEVLESQKT